MAAIALMKPDKLVILTALEGADRARDLGEQRMIEHHPDRVTPTRELMGRFPAPVEASALDSILEIRELHRQSEGEDLVSAADGFRQTYGWHPRVEWFRILGLELIHHDGLIEDQKRFLAELYGCLDGRQPADATENVEPYTLEVLEWAIGANHANLMEWLWREGRYEEALDQFLGSLRGLGGPEDDGRRIERHVYKASICQRLGRENEAAEALRAARSIDETRFEEVSNDLAPLMPELSRVHL